MTSHSFNRLVFKARFATALAVAFLFTGVLLATLGVNPFEVFDLMLSDALGSKFGLAEAIVRSIPVLLCALATALPAWIGLVNIGGEGQFYAGAIGGTAVVLLLPQLPPQTVLPLMLFVAFLAGALWAGLAGILKSAFNVNETLVSLLLNFVAILVVRYLVHGPWRDPASYSWPYSREFPQSALLPALGSTRIHAGLLIAIVSLLVLGLWKHYTIWGSRAKIIENNPDAARVANIDVQRFVIVAFLVAGGLAALAGICEVSAIQGRLRPEISPGYGYNGFLVAWLAKHKPLFILPATFFVGCLMVAGDSLQIKLGLPFATVNIILAVLLLSALAVESLMAKSKGKMHAR